jgi:regulatory protein gntR HTH
MRKTKSYKLESILERRIGMGDYTLLDFPAERKLAAAFNVTQMTVRKAVKNLEKRGLLERQPNGTVTVARIHGGTAVFLAPAFLSSHIFMFQRMLAAAAGKAGWQLRTVLYMHWDDACIEESLERFDGVFLYPVREKMSERLAELLRETETPVVALGADMSGLEIPSLLDRPADAEELMVDFLKNQGYRKIDFLLTQPRDTGSAQWLEKWRLRLKRHGLTGEFFEYPVESYGNSFEQAFRCVGTLIERNEFNSTCLLGATMAEAVGACRALASHGLVPGRDVAVSAVAGSRGGAAEYFIPSITAVLPGDCGGALMHYFEWMEQSGGRWPGELVCGGEAGQVFAGESVIPAEQLRGNMGKKEHFQENSR